jgi:O-6-methylguanine DNA methyltransferase
MNFDITSMPSAQLKKHLHQATSTSSIYSTPAGYLEVLQTNLGIYQVSFIDELPSSSLVLEYKFGDPLKLLLVGTDFQLQVYKSILQLPAGTTVSYQEVAHKIGAPRAHRAVANALANNKIAYFVPCHRIKRKNKSLGGYKWGIDKKIALLEAEKID